jgi:hypothetical protein
MFPMIRRFLVTLAATLVGAAQVAAAQAVTSSVRVSFLHSLSNFDGVIPFAGVGLAYDAGNRELYVVGDGVVRVFNDSGMEIYVFGNAEELGTPVSVAPLPSGDLLVLSWLREKLTISRCNFRGEFIGKFELHDAPAEWSDFTPSGIWYANGKVYLASLSAMKVLVADESGRYEWSRNLGPLLGIAPDSPEHAGLSGFSVDAKGNMLFTVQTLFRAFTLSPSGTLREFGAKGSAPGKFNVVSGIAADERGNIYVTDLLRCVVLVFNSDFKFLVEFGYRGRTPGRLTAPHAVVVGNGKAFVGQNAARGVSVFRITSD